MASDKISTAIRAFNQKQFDQSRAICADLMAENPNSPEAHYLLSKVCEAENQIEDALKYLSRAVDNSKSELSLLKNRIEHSIVESTPLQKCSEVTVLGSSMLDVEEAMVNQVEFQRQHWASALLKEDWDANKPYGYSWGDPENPKDPLGNYLYVKNRFLSWVDPDKVVLEIGSLAGKWVQYMIHAKRVICVDINDVGFSYIKKRFPQNSNLEFYLTKGEELNGIESGTVDLVYSMDTLVRVPKACIRNYVLEAHRVLKESGRIALHLPCSEIPGSQERNFVKVSLSELVDYYTEAGFRDIVIDIVSLVHGVFIHAIR